MLGTLWCRCSWEVHLWIRDLLHAEWGSTASCRMCLRDGTMLMDIKLKYFQKSTFWNTSFEVPTTITFRSHACGNIEWSFSDHLPKPKVEFWWAGPLEVIISVGWKTICRIPQHFLPSSPSATCWKSTEKWKMELTCDSGLRNQPSCCLFRTTASAGRPSN